MLFPSATIDSIPVRLLLIRPNMDRGRVLEITHDFETQIGEGRTSIEERRPTRALWLLAQRFTITPSGNAADDWRKGLAALGNNALGVPLWIDALPVARWSERVYQPEKVVNFDPVTGAFAVYNLADVPGSPAHPLLAPLMLCRWQSRPPAEPRSGRMAEAEIDVREARPWSCRIDINSQAGGWTAAADWASAPVRDESVHGLEASRLPGTAASEPILDRTNSAARWRQQAGFTFGSRLAVRQHLTHFKSVKGALSAWAPVPAFFKPGVDTPQTPDSYTARFDSGALTLRFRSGSVAQAEVAFIEEVNTAPRSQALPGEAFLYALTYQHDTGNPELYTNWDAPLTGTEGAFQPDQCVHEELVLSLRPQDLKAELQLGYRAGTLAADWIVRKLYGWVRLDIWRCDPDDVAGTRKHLFSGFVRSILPDGNTLALTATLFGKKLDRDAPSDIYGRSCNTWLTSPRCTKTVASVKTDGTIAPADLSADGLTLTVHGATGFGGPAYADDWFAPNGSVTTGTGRGTMNATITHSTTSAGNLVLTLDRPFWAEKIAGGGQAVQLIPACQGRYQADCIGRFANGANFQGFEFMPDYIEQRAPGMKSPKK